MLTIYIIGVIVALIIGYESYGEELCEKFPLLTEEESYWVLFFAAVCSFTSWFGCVYFLYRHEINLK